MNAIGSRWQCDRERSAGPSAPGRRRRKRCGRRLLTSFIPVSHGTGRGPENSHWAILRPCRSVRSPAIPFDHLSSIHHAAQCTGFNMDGCRSVSCSRKRAFFESSAAARSAITFGCAASRRRRMKASGVSNRSPRACTRVVVWRTALKEDTRTCSGAWRQFCGIRMFSGARHECRAKGEQRMASPLDRRVMVAIGCSGGDKGSRKIFREAVMRAARRRSEGCSAMRNFSRKIR